MKFDFLEIIVIISLFQLLVFAGFLFTQRPYKMSNIFLGIFLFAEAMAEFNAIVYLNYGFFNKNYPHLLLIEIPFYLLWGPSIYFFVKSIISNKFKLNVTDIIHVIPFIAVFLFLFFTFYQYSGETKRIILKTQTIYTYLRIIQYAVFLQILIYNIKSLLILKVYRSELKNNYSSTTKVNLSWLNFVIIGYLITYFTSVLCQITIDALRDYYPLMEKILYLTYFIFFNIIFFKAWRQPEIFLVSLENIKYKSSKLTTEDAANWINKINEYVLINKPYLNPDLTISQLAEYLNIQPRILSQVLNEHFHQSFYDYINSLRIEESKKILLDPSNKKNILEILYEVGFNSKPSFNRAFKLFTGQTPTEFKRSIDKESEVIIKNQ